MPPECLHVGSPSWDCFGPTAVQLWLLSALLRAKNTRPGLGRGTTATRTWPGSVPTPAGPGPPARRVHLTMPSGVGAVTFPDTTAGPSVVAS